MNSTHPYFTVDPHEHVEHLFALTFHLGTGINEQPHSHSLHLCQIYLWNDPTKVPALLRKFADELESRMYFLKSSETLVHADSRPSDPSGGSTSQSEEKTPTTATVTHGKGIL